MTSVSSATAATNSSTTTSTATAGLAKNFSTFLTLLTTQLQNQDPLNPMDSNEFTSQLVQFAQVEQSINANSTLSNVLSALQGQATASAVGYIGKEVAVPTPTAAFDGTTPVTWQYAKDTASASTTLTIVDAKGQTVRSLTGTAAAGTTSYTWDGKDADGDVVDAGSYTLKITALDSAGKATETTISTMSLVTGVDSGGSAIELVTKNGNVAIDEVTKVASSD
ncbi:MAG: flagellar hook assembly protein FlgD [Zavarzinia sp.]|nr:flagellar hook assembly protein FlgD [Zavarzinia sp.]